MMVAAVGFFASMNVAVKLIGPDYHPIQVTFMRNLVAAIVIVPFILRTGGLSVLRTKRPWGHAARSLGGIIGTVLYFYAFVHLPLADVMVISQAVPLFVALLAVMILKEKVGWRRWAAISVGFVGVLVTLDPTGQIHPAALMTVLATAFWAGTILLMRSLGRTESPYAVVFYYMVAGAVLTAVALPWVWRAPPPDVYALFVIAGVLGAFGQILMTYALKFAEASLVSPFNYTAILWGMIFDLAIWGVAPDAATLWGAAIVTVAGLYLVHRERLLRKVRPPAGS